MKKSTLLLIISGLALLSYTISCKKAEILSATTTDVNIYSYLIKSPDDFSEFAKILEKANYSEFLNAYGAYTCFVPNNAAVKQYYQDIGKSGVEALSVKEAEDISKIHLIQDTLNTNNFTDGKLPQITMYGQYLLTGVTNKNGLSSYTVNRLALITQPNIKLANGIVHVIDHVLKPATLTVAQTIEQNPDFSIFTQALKETGYYDSLNIVNNPDTTRKFLTVVAETNQALRDSGITSYAQLKAKYSKTGSPKRVDDSLHLYAAYHILPDAKYLADVVSTVSLNTLAPLEVLTSGRDGETVLLNDIYFGQPPVHEPGVILDRALSDVTASNGVVHTAKAHFTIKVRVPSRLDFDVCDQPELRKIPALWRKSSLPLLSSGGGTPFAKGFFADIDFGSNTGTAPSVSYVFTGPTNTTYWPWWGDYLRIPMGNTSRNIWVQFRTPLIVKGRYKVWICYSRVKASNNNPAFPMRVTFDGTPMQRTFGFDEQKPAGTPGELEALGWKQYTEAPLTNSGADINNVARLVGTIDIPVTGRHLLRMDFLANSSGQENNLLDMIQFIPIADNQQRPIFGRDGRIIP